METKTAQLTCPHCEAVEEVEVPEGKCLPFHECASCGTMISVPKDSDNCCVICEYSDSVCPLGHPDH